MTNVEALEWRVNITVARRVAVTWLVCVCASYVVDSAMCSLAQSVCTVDHSISVLSA